MLIIVIIIIETFVYSKVDENLLMRWHPKRDSPETAKS